MPQSMDRSLIATTTTRARRVTREEVVKLKVTTEKKGFLSGIGNFFKSMALMLSVKPAAKPKTDCKIAGHVMPASGWPAGKLPLCVDCGQQINNATQLRNSVWKA